jgi:TRAP-type C4-dicarboxylate transport system substrate-binding protein
MTKSDFRSALYSIVARCHVADSHKTAFEYAKSRLKKGHWDKQSPEYQKAFAQACAELHEENRQLYTSVMKGIL